MKDERGWIDGVAWAVAPALVLTVVGVGAINGDAIRHANGFATGSWSLNPNHLLMEPVAALWFDVAAALGWGDTRIDRLKLLNFWVGGLTLGLFRCCVAPALTDRRSYRNLSTAVLGGLQAFLVYWISGEPILMQMPVLVAVAIPVLDFAERPTARSAAWMGAGFGLASLFFVSNVVIGASVFLSLTALGLVSTGDRGLDLRRGAAYAAGAVGVAGSGFAWGWMLSGSGQSLTAWVTQYAGRVPVGEHLFGMGELSLASIVAGGARTVYGTVRAFVEIAPTVDAVRGGSAWSFWSAAAPVVASLLVLAVVYCLARMVVRGRGRIGLTVAIGGWVLGVLGFGIFYNNSDGQYFIQLAVPIALAVAAGLPDERENSRWAAAPSATVVLLLLGIVWNASYISAAHVTYPRQERLEQLRTEVTSASLVVYPGSDTTGHLLHLLPDTLYEERLSLTTWAYRHPGREGLGLLADSLRSVLESTDEVRVVSVYGDVPEGQPWSVLRTMGYAQEDLVAMFEQCSAVVLDSLGTGFATRSVAGDPECIGRTDRDDP